MTLHWGIAATGTIARDFVSDLALLPDTHISAVGSRTQERADEFGTTHGITVRHPSYEALAADPNVDVVYVASPQSRHMRDVLLFLDAGKHVLCEKPFALNAAEAMTMATRARANGRFLMEGIWSRFLPAYVHLRRLLAEERVGEPMVLDACFGFRMPVAPENRLFSKALGGGALLDLGIYPVQLASLVFGAPDEVLATGDIGATGFDERVALLLHHPAGGIATLRAAIRTVLPSEAVIAGSRGSIRLPTWMHCPDHLLFTDRAGSERIDAAFEGNVASRLARPKAR